MLTHKTTWFHALAQAGALAGALLWGLVEVIALWRSRWIQRLHRSAPDA